MSDFVRINNNAISTASVSFKIAGDPYTGITGITYGAKRERVKGRSLTRHQAPTRRSSGIYTPDPLKLKVYKATAAAIRQQLALISGVGSYGNAIVPIFLQFIEPGETTTTVDFQGCAYVTETSDQQDGAELLTEDIEFDVMTYLVNGLSLADTSRGRP